MKGSAEEKESVQSDRAPTSSQYEHAALNLMAAANMKIVCVRENSYMCVFT